MILYPPLHHPLRYGLILLDADGTLRETVVEGAVQPRPPNQPGEWRLLPNVQKTLATYDWTVHHCGVVSNQGGCALGFLTEATARFLLQETLTAAVQGPVSPQQIWVCPHAPDAGCACRKPGTLLLEQALLQYQKMRTKAGHLALGRKEMVYIGDQTSDHLAAKRFGCDFIWAWDFFGRPLPL